jgi:hypothetical protein
LDGDHNISRIGSSRALFAITSHHRSSDASTVDTVIASEAKQSIVPLVQSMDCFVASAPRNDGANNIVLAALLAPEPCQKFHRPH